MLSKNIFFIFFSIFFISWVFIYNISENLIYHLIILLVLLWTFSIIFLFNKKINIYYLFTIFWYIFWIILWYNNLINITSKQNYIKKYINIKQEYIIEIKDIYKIKDKNIEYIWKLKQIWNQDSIYNINTILIYPKTYQLKIWDIIKINTKIKHFKNFDWFKYEDYMLSKNLYFYSYLYDFEIMKTNNQNFIKKYSIKIKEHFLSIINKIYPKEEAIFLGWILIWERKSLPKELKTDFNNSWLTHFIAVSWFNITILIIFLSYILKYFPIFLRVILISWFILFFCLIVWDTAPVIRAAIMWLVWYYILISWRQWHSLAIILFTLLIMIILSPTSINYDVSLQLSFLAVIWIIYCNKYYLKIFNFLPNTLEIKTAFCLTLSALTTTLPIIIVNFWYFSILSPLSNIAVSWTIALAMLWWFVSIILYIITPILWIFIWYFVWVLLKWDIIIVHLFWQAKWALLEIDLTRYNTIFLILYFMILIYIILKNNIKKNN